MARELQPVETPYRTRRYTCANATAISKGTLLKLTDPFTVAAYDGATVQAAVPLAGVAAMDKEANDGSTDISVWVQGRFEATASGAIAVGRAFVGLANNYITEASGGITLAASGAIIGGYVLETAADAEKVNIILNL